MSGKKGGGKKGNEGGKKAEGADFKFDFGQGGKNTFDLAGKDAALLPFIQKKLDTLVGKSSGYLEELPLSVQNRVKALKKLHATKSTLDDDFKKELQALHDKYDKLFAPLYDRRRDIVQGISEPTAEELKEEKAPEKEEKTEVKQEGEKAEKKEPNEGKDVKGIPDFWMEAFKHHDYFGDMITKKDEGALKHLIDVRWKPVAASAEKNWSRESFVLEFEFEDNAYFTNKIISKSYFLQEHEAMGETIFDHVEASKIEWKAGKNLTVKMVQVQQPVGGGKRGGRGGRGRGKSQGKVKTVTVEEPCESFFNFFNEDVTLGLEDDDLQEDDLQNLHEEDYELGLAIKEQVISSAVLWFTGEIPTLGSMDDDGEDDGDEDGEYDSAEDPDFEEPVAGEQAPGGEQKPECAQQ